MQKKIILQVGEFPPVLQRIIDEEFISYPEGQYKINPGIGEQVEAILTRSNQVVPAALINSLPNLKIISTSGVGWDRIPIEAARGRNVIVTNTPGVLDSAVGELSIGLLLALLRQIPQADCFVRSGAWEKCLFPLSEGLAGKFVGIIGMGGIGRSVAQRLAGFDVTIGYCARGPKDLPYAYFTALPELATRADVLVVCCPGGEATRHLINNDILDRLGPDGYLVNIARGSVVDEQALIAALERKAIRGAALDVFEQEPLSGSRLVDMPNVLLSPHVGSATEETRLKMLRLALNNIHQVLNGLAPLTPV